MLESVGILVKPHELWIQEGGYRNWHWDLARWGGNGVRKDSGFKVVIYSWDKMTDCVRHGFNVDDGSNSEDTRKSPWEIEIHRLPAKRNPSIFD